MRFWDIASGDEVRQIALGEFSWKTPNFSTGAEKIEHKTDWHLIKVARRSATLLITKLIPLEGEEGVKDGSEGSEDGAAPVATRQRRAAAAPIACFKAPQDITAVRCHGATICVGGVDGAVCFLQAPVLAV